MTIRLYDTLRRAKVDFEPADPKRVTMYVCGPTVYDRAHIGNARPAVVFDVLRRLLRHTYGDDAVVYARNITDIDDKIIAAADARGVDIGTVTRAAEDQYLADMRALGVDDPDHAPHATRHVEGPGGMVAMIGELVARGHAYAAQGHVLFDVASFAGYGALSHRRLDEMVAGSRVEVAPYKRGAADFILWKPSSDGQPGWPSPWGRGRPGWHIECSAMIRAVLGQTIDIHGGGLDLIFPHHENELAQSVCANAAPLARVWLHNGFLSMGSDKMSKSLGNVVAVEDLLAAGHRPEHLRFAILSAHYRQPLEWTTELIGRSQRTMDRWHGALVGKRRGEVHQSVVEALSDDLNTPEAIAALSALAKADNWPALWASAEFMGFSPKNYRSRLRETAEDVIDAQVAGRTAARARKDFAESDRIRDALAAQGIVLEDGAGGTTWRRA